jgi:hypothetical protein
MSTVRPLGLGLVLALVACFPASVGAATQQRLVLTIGSGICSANNPANEPNLRYLTTGVKNAGSTTISMVCAEWGDRLAGAAPTSVYVIVANDRLSTVGVSCTLSQGTFAAGQVAVTKSVSIGAAAFETLTWTQSDYGASQNQQPLNLQCSLPPAGVLRDIGYYYDEPVA